MDDVPDFLVLKQVYDAAIKRPWKCSQQFRSLMNDDCGVQMWWEGKFVKSEPLDANFPESKFLCYCITYVAKFHLQSAGIEDKLSFLCLYFQMG